MSEKTVAICGHLTSIVRKGLCYGCYRHKLRHGHAGLSNDDIGLITQLLRDHRSTSPRALAKKFGVREAIILEIEQAA